MELFVDFLNGYEEKVKKLFFEWAESRGVILEEYFDFEYLLSQVTEKLQETQEDWERELLRKVNRI